MRAAESQDIPVVDDLEDLSTGHGAEHWLKWINRDVRASSLSVMSSFTNCVYYIDWSSI